MSTQDPIAAAIQSHVDAGNLAGAVTAVWRGGQLTQSSAVGWSNLAARTPLSGDSIFRIASLTIPITSTAALMLMDEGAFALDDPISRWAPEFTDMRVLSAPDGPLDASEPAARQITFEDLLTHRSGVTNGGFHTGPIAAAYPAALGKDIDSHLAPDDWIAALASLPLIDQPGAGFHYGNSTDLLGLLIARIEGAPLGEVLQRRIFGPLGMKDTGFVVPPEKHSRRAGLCGFDEAGRLTDLVTVPGGMALAERPADMTFVSGAAGLWSTAPDYLAFARMFLGDGSVDGVRLLRPETLRLMTTNHLTDAQRAKASLLGMPVFTGHGFGLGVAVVMDPDKAPITRCRGAVGTVGWPGAYGGWWQADPADGSVMILLAHNMLELDQLMSGVGLGVYMAITQMHGLAGGLGR